MSFLGLIIAPASRVVASPLSELVSTTLQAQTSPSPLIPKELPAPEAKDETVKSLLISGRGMLASQKFEDALSLSEKAVSAAKASQDFVGEALGRRLYAGTLEVRNHYKGSVVAWKECAAAWEKVGDGPGQVQALGRASLVLGIVVASQSNQSENRGHGEQDDADAAAIEERRLREAVLKLAANESRRPLATASCLHDLGGLAIDRGNLAAAEDYLKEALNIQERLAPASLDAANSLDWLGIAARNRGDLSGAEGYLKQALDIEQRLAPNSLDIANLLENLGEVARDRGRLSVAKGDYTRSLEIRQRLAPRSLDVADSLNGLGVIEFNRSNLAAAEEYLRQALEIRESLAPGSLDVATTLENLGVIAGSRGNFAVAEDYLKQALDIKRRISPGSLNFASSLSNLGVVARHLGHLAAAEDYYKQAMEIRENLAPGSLDVATLFVNLGNVALDRGNPTAAEDYYKQSLEIKHRLSPESLDVASCLDNLGNVAISRGNIAVAEDYYKQAIQIVEKQRRDISGANERVLFSDQHTNLFASLTGVYLVQKRPAEALTVVERGRARSFQEMIIESPFIPANLPTELKNKQQDIDTRRRQAYKDLGALGKKGNNDGDHRKIEAQAESLRSLLVRLNEEQNNLTQQIRLADPRYASVAYPQPLTTIQAQQALGPDTLALVYLVNANNTYLFAVSQNSLDYWILPVTEKDLTTKVNTLRSLFKSQVPFIAYQKPASELYDLLVRPAQAQLQRISVKRVLLCLDGPLRSLSFGALWDKNGKSGAKGRIGCYFEETHPLHTAPSLTAYVQLRKLTRLLPIFTPTRVVALGNPAYENSSAKDKIAFYSSDKPTPASPPLEHATSAHDPLQLQQLVLMGGKHDPLPITLEQVSTLKILYPRPATFVSLTDKNATRSSVLSNAQGADLLHFGCHGFADNQDPLASALVLAPQDGQDDGLLRAWEVMGKLRLKDGALVVLGACETGLGKETKSEGILGLTQAFHYAGASRVVVSEWSVGANATNALLVAFYRNLKAGMAVDVALQQAQLQLLHAKSRLYSHPFFWAPFVLSGAPE